MSILKYIEDDEWDNPVYKKLANNDTGAAKGNQGGVLIPKELRKYFPLLEGQTDSVNPTLDVRIYAELIVNLETVDHVKTRYQIQTWGGSRKPERRLTENLGKLLKLASGGDYLLVQRKKDSINMYRLILITANNPEYSVLELLTKNSAKNWGVLGDREPVDFHEIETAEKEIETFENNEFTVIDDTAASEESIIRRISRSSIFKKHVLEAYEYKCSILGYSLVTPDGKYELEAAHIVPRSRMGPDDVRNGLALTRSLHWAFDKGLFSFDEKRRVYVPRLVRNIPGNELLNTINGNPMLEATNKAKRAHDKAIAWHRENILISE